MLAQKVEKNGDDLKDIISAADPGKTVVETPKVIVIIFFCKVKKLSKLIQFELFVAFRKLHSKYFCSS